MEKTFVTEQIALNQGTSEVKHIARGETMQVTLVGGTVESPMPDINSAVVMKLSKPAEIYHPTHATAYFDVAPGTTVTAVVVDQVEELLGNKVQAFD